MSQQLKLRLRCHHVRPLLTTRVVDAPFGQDTRRIDTPRSRLQSFLVYRHSSRGIHAVSDATFLTRPVEVSFMIDRRANFAALIVSPENMRLANIAAPAGPNGGALLIGNRVDDPVVRNRAWTQVILQHAALPQRLSSAWIDCCERRGFTLRTMKHQLRFSTDIHHQRRAP